MVEDDAGSDGEIERLSSIIEEEEVVDRWVRRRSNASSNTSVNGAVHSYDICDLWLHQVGERDDEHPWY